MRELADTPYHSPPRWTPRPAGPQEADAGRGLRLSISAAVAGTALATAVADLHTFLRAAGVPAGRGFDLALVPTRRGSPEDFCLRVGPDRATLTAASPEGLRRGLYWVEDEMRRRGGPFLPLGTHRVRLWVRTRISRCFYGPVNRPPRQRDELADDEDYYPDEYLNRLAHEGVNALWLTLHFFQAVPSRLIPEYGRDAARRLDKLRRTAAKCGRYGIRIYPFCIEPAGFTWPYPEVQAARVAHPDLVGHGGAFCTSTEKGRAYLHEAARTLFTAVPELGGLIVIPVGERQTHCYSGVLPRDDAGGPLSRCPRCALRQPWEVLAATLAALRDGMRSASPDAELIAWPYGQLVCWGAERTVEAAAHMPAGVVLQHNFETGGTNTQLGRPRPTWDYWLSYVGPSELFVRCARAARPGRVAAKLQVSCSHEVATAQLVPVPGLLYRKYRAMRRLGVSAAMHSWYFGAYPSLMTRAAGLLSQAPFPRSEDQFLRRLAQADWQEHTDTVVRAWKLFARAYRNYPTAHVFAYYGPMHDGPVWPLYLIPRRLPLAPTWQIGYPPSGDYIAECVTNGFTLGELVELARRQDAIWNEGVRRLESLRPACAGQPERVADLDIAAALGLQFRSGHHILRFYALRERLAEARAPARRRRLLGELERLVRAECAVTRALLPLARRQSCLGFHAEAEGYKYFPALLEWRVRQLERLLATEFPAVAARLDCPAPLFARYTGAAAQSRVRAGGGRLRGPAPGGRRAPWPRQAAWVTAALERLPVGPVAACPPAAAARPEDPDAGVAWQRCTHWLLQVFDAQRWQRCPYDRHAYAPVPLPQRQGRTTRWRATHDGHSVRFVVECWSEAAGAGQGTGDWAGESLQVAIEPVRTQPRLLFGLSPAGTCTCTHDDGYIPRGAAPWRAVVRCQTSCWRGELTVPLAWLRPRLADRWRPLRVNVVRTMPVAGAEGVALCSWAAQRPVQGRLVWGTLNPATDFGWLVLERQPRRRGQPPRRREEP